MLEAFLVFLEGFCDGPNGIAIIYHTYLYSIRVDIFHHGLYLSFHDFRFHILNAIHSLGVLYGDGCDCGSGIYAQCRHRLDVSLNASSSATVRAGYC